MITFITFLGSIPWIILVHIYFDNLKFFLRLLKNKYNLKASESPPPPPLPGILPIKNSQLLYERDIHHIVKEGTFLYPLQ